MGMYSKIYCTIDLGPGFYNRTLDFLDPACAEYWLDKRGRLWSIDYSYVSAFSVDGKIEPSGMNGRIYPSNMCGLIVVRPNKWNAHYAPCPTKTLTFYNGVLEGYK